MKISWVKTSKFKDYGLSLRFSCVNDENINARKALLAFMLQDRCVKYPTKEKMIAKRDELYNAQCSITNTGYGYRFVTDFRMRFLKPSMIDDPNYLEDCLSFYHDLLFEPLFTEEILEENKQLLLTKIESMEDDVKTQVILEGFKHCSEEYPLGFSAYNKKEYITKLTLDDIKETYHSLIHDDEVEMICCVDEESEELVKLINKYFPFEYQKKIDKSYYKIKSSELNRKVFIEKDIDQSEVMLVYYTNTSRLDDDYYPLCFANALLGQFSTSLLFQEIREKHGLCYSIGSSLVRYEGVLHINVGVSNDKVDETIDLIKQQIERLIKMDYDDSYINNALAMLTNRLYSGNDYMINMHNKTYAQNILNLNETEEDIIEKYRHVSKEDVARVMRKLQLELQIVIGRKE